MQAPDLQVLDREGQMDNPCTSWLTDSSWDNVTELDKLPNFHGIMNSFEQYPKDWNNWFTNASPESAPLPGLSTASFFINLAGCIITCFKLVCMTTDLINYGEFFADTNC